MWFKVWWKLRDSEIPHLHCERCLAEEGGSFPEFLAVSRNRGACPDRWELWSHPGLASRAFGS